MTATMACGHRIAIDADGSAPRCGECGETRVSHVKAPAPRFRGTALGPCATYEDLPAKRVVLKENG